MKINDFLSKNREAIINRWLDLIFASYPKGSANILKEGEDRFANPMGWIIRNGVSDIFDGIVEKNNLDKFYSILNNIIRLRAVQELTPSAAISFIFHLKQAIRENLNMEDVDFKELLLLESKIDDMAGISFDIYMRCREKIAELKGR